MGKCRSDASSGRPLLDDKPCTANIDKSLVGVAKDLTDPFQAVSPHRVEVNRHPETLLDTTIGEREELGSGDAVEGGKISKRDAEAVRFRGESLLATLNTGPGAIDRDASEYLN